jgi:hypothetical protein
MNTTKPARNFYKCRQCLAVMATEGFSAAATSAACSCGGALKYMGRVRFAFGIERLARDHQETPCDARCTNAPGPSCDCSCGGKNHGTKRLVTVVTDAGPVPQLLSPSPERAAEFAAAKDAARAAFDAKFPGVRSAYENGFHIDATKWDHFVTFSRGLKEAAKIANHKKRIAALGALVAAEVA